MRLEQLRNTKHDDEWWDLEGPDGTTISGHMYRGPTSRGRVVWWVGVGNFDERWTFQVNANGMVSRDAALACAERLADEVVRLQEAAKLATFRDCVTP